MIWPVEISLRDEVAVRIPPGGLSVWVPPNDAVKPGEKGSDGPSDAFAPF